MYRLIRICILIKLGIGTETVIIGWNHNIKTVVTYEVIYTSSLLLNCWRYFFLVFVIVVFDFETWFYNVTRLA